MSGTPSGIRTRVASVKGMCPRPLDDGGRRPLASQNNKDDDRVSTLKSVLMITRSNMAWLKQGAGLLLPYRTFNSYLVEKFGTRVYGVPVNLGFACPNRDGTRAFGGCSFCDERGGGAPTIKPASAVATQLQDGIARITRRYKAQKFLTYFQAFTNTYAPEGILRPLYESGLAHPDVVGMCVGTRPDCVPDHILDLLAEFSRRTFVLLEMGLQTVHNRTLEAVNRAHTAGEFFEALSRAKARGLTVATHLIFGLPGEDREMMLETVRQVAASPVDAVKIHQLCVYRGSPIELDYRQGRLNVLDEDFYAELVVDALELLPPEKIVMRLVAEGKKTELVAPTWSYDKFTTMDKIRQEFARRATRQGSRCLSTILSPCLDIHG
jgi:uncharacterized protein